MKVDMLHTLPKPGDNQRELIKYALRVQGLTLTDVAKDLDVSGATLSIVIKGERRSRRIAEHVASVLDSTVDELWPGVYAGEEGRP